MEPRTLSKTRDEEVVCLLDTFLALSTDASGLGFSGGAFPLPRGCPCLWRGGESCGRKADGERGTWLTEKPAERPTNLIPFRSVYRSWLPAARAPWVEVAQC